MKYKSSLQKKEVEAYFAVDQKWRKNHFEKKPFH